MNVEKFLIVLFVLITFLLMSVGGVFAEDIKVNETLQMNNASDDSVLMEDSLYSNNNQSQNNILQAEDNELVANFTSDVNKGTNSLTVNFTDTSKGNPTSWLWDFGDGFNSTVQNPVHTYNQIGYFNVTLKVYSDDSSDNIVKNDFIHVCYDKVILANPDFEEGNKWVGWDYSASSIYPSQNNAKSGRRFALIENGGFISQIVNLDTVDYIGFWYSSTSLSSRVNVLLDDEVILKHSNNVLGMGIWEFVLLNFSDVTGFHTLKFAQSGDIGYLDSFEVIQNDDILVNFTLTSFSLNGDNLTLSFNDYSYGLIDGWLWDFGDGTTSTSQNVTHSYKTGHYTVSLTVFNENTAKTMRYVVPITFPSIVGFDREFGSVQEAIDSAVSGDVISIPYNIFYSSFMENLVIDKDLTLNFFNCSLVGDGVNPVISVVNGANVIVNDIVLDDNVILRTDKLSKLTVSKSVLKNISLNCGNIQLCDNDLSDCIILIDGANVNVSNSNFVNSGVIINEGEVFVFNNSFSLCDVAISQNGGNSIIISNIFADNHIGVNVVGGSSNISFNSIYNNDVGLVYNSTIVNVNNWWGKNYPVYVCSNQITNCDVCQIGGIESSIVSWLILNISQSSFLDYDYWIAGVTYYNLTVDLTHNNYGEDITNLGCLKDLNLTLTNFNQYLYYMYHNQLNPWYEKLMDEIIQSEDCEIVNGVGECIFSLGYLTNDLDELNITVLNQSYIISLEYNLIEPKITYVTPTAAFDDNLTVEISCDDSDAVIFYTLDGSNPGYSSTRLVYTNPFVVDKSTTVHYTVINRWGNFQKDLRYSILNGFNVVQDVFVEISGNSHYYLFDSLINNIGITDYWSFDVLSEEQLKNAVLYTHPFIVREPTVIYHREISSYSDAFRGYIAHHTIIKFYNFDFSVNYIKNTTVNESDAIWSQYQGDNHNTGVSNMSGPLHNQSSWVNNAILSSGSVVVDGKGHIYVGGDDGYLYCLNNQGLVIWRYGTTSKILCTPTLGSDGNIYFSNWWNSSVYCISPEGQLVWKYNLGDFNTGTSPVFGLNNNLYILTSNSLYSNMYVFNKGVLVGNYSVPLISGSTPVVSSDGSLYLVSARHELVCLNWDGSLRFTRMLGDFRYDNYIQNNQISISMDSNDTLYVLRGQHTDNRFGYFSYNVVSSYYSNGTVRWINPLGDYLVSGTPSYYNGVLYITVNDVVEDRGNRNMLGGCLIALNATNGNLLWSKSIASSGSTLSSPLVSGDEIIYVTSNNCVYAFNISGEKIWEYTMTGKYGNPVSYSSPVLSNKGTLIVTTNQGIFAFNDISADFTYEHVNGTASTIQFIDLSTEGNNRYYWTFGDGNFSRDQNPVHEYASGGKYRVVLLVEHNGVVLARNTTIEVVYHDIVPPSNVSAYINDTLTLGGNFSETQYISLNASDDFSGIVIYYTVDGSNPLNSSTRRVYSNPFDVEVDTVLTCIAVDTAGNIGNITQFTFKILDALVVNLTLADEIQKLLDEAEPYSKFVFSHDVIDGANFTVNKPLNIISNNNTRLIGNGIQPVFTFTENASGSTLNGFSINNTSVGILIKDSTNITVRNCFVNVSDGIGINILNSVNTTVKYTSVNNCDEGIIVNKSDSTLLDNVYVGDCYSDGIWIYQSVNTDVVNSVLEGNGKDPYKIISGENTIGVSANGQLRLITNVPASQSRANNILIDDSSNTNLINNTINYGYFGVRLYHTTNDVTIADNVFYEGVGDAILLSNEYYNVNITHNTIDGCYNGIDFMGYSENVSIVENLIENLHIHDNDLQTFESGTLLYDLADYVYETHFPPDEFFNHCYNGIQISYPASNVDEGNTIMIDNVVIKLSHRAWEARKYKHYLDAGCDGYGYNLLDGSASYTGQGGATRYREGKVDLVVDRIGDATFRLRLINRLDNHYLKNIPEFNVTFRAGGFLQTVKFINDSAIATFDVASVVSDIEVIISTEIRKSASFTMEITEGYSGSNRKVDPGFERGEAYDNPDPVIPKFPEPEDDYKPSNPVVNPPINYPQEPDEPTGYGNGTGNGQGNGTGQGTGTGDGNGSSGSFGNGTSNILTDIISDTPGMIGDSAENITDEIKSENVISNVVDSSEIGEATTTESSDDSEGMDRSREGGSDAGNGETVNAYEVSKVINVDESNWQFVAAVILFAVIIILGYGYRRGKKDGDEF